MHILGTFFVLILPAPDVWVSHTSHHTYMGVIPVSHPFLWSGQISQLPLTFSWLVGSFFSVVLCWLLMYRYIGILDFGILVPVFFSRSDGGV